jgi:cobyrinic acid a,c-diamide synthase
LNQLYLSAAHKSSGKTTLALGLCAAYAARGLSVSPFKKGPDYIDPMWLSMAAEAPCHTLDFYTMEQEEILAQYEQGREGRDLVLVEGNKGLFDGVSLDGHDCNGAMAKLLELPVLLVINTNGITRGIAPLLIGYQQFDPMIRYCGVILNQTGGERHEQKLRQVVEHYTDFSVLGAVRRHPDLEIVERHLGLVPGNEAHQAHNKIELIRRAVESQVDLDLILERTIIDQPIMVDDSVVKQKTAQRLTPRQSKVRIGIARDEAFGFYYEADLEAFENEGAELVPFSPIHDDHLPEMDGLLIGGGFPETHMAQLEQNSVLRVQIQQLIESGLPAYAECGGMMYLCRQISWEDHTHQMVGVIQADCVMHRRPQGRGYVRFRRQGEEKGIPAHEFHYSSLENLSDDTTFSYAIQRGFGIDGKNDGIVYKNLLASYLHQRNTRLNPWVKGFVRFVRQLNKEEQP